MLRSVTLKNFKSFRDATVPLGPFTLVVGTNASGKSNLRDALRFLHGVGLGFSVPEILGEKVGPGGVVQWTGIRGGALEAAYHGAKTFTLGATLASAGEEDPGASGTRYEVEINTAFAFRLIPLPRAANPGPNSAMVTAEHIVSPGRPVLVLYDGKAATGTPLVSAAVAKPHLTAQQGSTPGDTLLAQSVTTALASMRFLDLEPDSIREPSWPGQAILGDRGERLASVVQKLCADPTSERVLMSWVQALTPMDVTAIDIKSDLGGRLLVYLRDSGGHEISAWSASDGTLRFLGLAAALLSAEPGTLFFLEEIDTGIHPTRLHLLVQLIEQACSQRGVQVIATTHNAGMLSLLRSDARDAALLVYRADGAPDSQVRRLMELPDIARVLEKHDIARLHASGWLEQAAAYAESLARGEEP